MHELEESTHQSVSLSQYLRTVLDIVASYLYTWSKSFLLLDYRLADNLWYDLELQFATTDEMYNMLFTLNTMWCVFNCPWLFVHLWGRFIAWFIL